MRSQGVDERLTVRIEEFLDFRALLRALLDQRKHSGRAHSLRALARRSGLRSTNYLTLVLAGQRTPSPETAERLAQALGLKRREAAYFCELVALARASTAAQRAEHHTRLSRLRSRGTVRELLSAQADYHSQWYIPAVRELVERDDFREDAGWIARALLPPITQQKAARALETLVALGLVQRDARGRLRQADPLVSTGAGPLGHHIVGFHRAMLDRASEAIDLVLREEREISALTLGVSEALVPQLKQRIREFRSELLHLAQGQPTERVVQINLQLFPLSQPQQKPPLATSQNSPDSTEGGGEEG